MGEHTVATSSKHHPGTHLITIRERGDWAFWTCGTCHLFGRSRRRPGRLASVAVLASHGVRLRLRAQEAAA